MDGPARLEPSTRENLRGAPSGEYLRNMELPVVVSEQSATQSIEESVAESGDSVWWRLFKFVVLVGIIVGLYELSVKLGSLTLDLRLDIKKKVPIWSICVTFVILNIVYKLLPVLYLCLPLNLVAEVALADKLGPEKATIIMQAMMASDAIVFYVLHIRWKDTVDEILAGRMWWMPSELAAIVFLFMACYFMDDLVNLMWLSTRSGITFPVFLVGFLPGLAAEYPKQVLRLRIVISVADVIGSGSSNIFSILTSKDLQERLQLTPAFIVIFVLVNIVPTFIVYIAHINFILRAVVSCYKRKSSRNAHAPDDNEAFAPGSDSGEIEIGSAHAEQDKKEED
ncbi:hypothetical protein GUITHDRAFT_100817 [Guillardia theta CCMP2712]|uniref:Uncharacterized protein n=1 Tax=Guillardia theta (strain CCMP2712) TaxID=905079 RepID=L1JZ65_GUITC|nr:hypothetical protein GUITHDRAFT_100817 [Guillardia theta CCMP2712]EKX53851.1 hypothetical protein GUITHDRAFT_100817 [Guillardia theta CCMP2712]|eukprot:XP_005840831.1 hypothetical protein GUITHDRAFT_100817 [Guillardia theta CCMP2712]